MLKKMVLSESSKCKYCTVDNENIIMPMSINSHNGVSTSNSDTEKILGKYKWWCSYLNSRTNDKKEKINAD